MRRLPGIFITLFSVVAAGICPALSVDPKLLSLAPPGAAIVAGMDTPPPKDQPGSFVLISHSNSVDLEDSSALIGVDSSRIVLHIVFVATADNSGHLDGHSLLLSGHFDQERIYQSIIQGGGKAFSYRGIALVDVPPLARERESFHEDRWLAVLDSDLLLFGTISDVRLEIDRYLAHSAADPVLLARLTRLHHDDETWTILSAPTLNSEVRNALESLDPRLAELAEKAKTFQFSTRYHRQVEFAYEATMASASNAHATQNAFLKAFSGSGWGFSLLPSEPPENDRTVKGTIRISTERFGRWLKEVPPQGGQN